MACGLPVVVTDSCGSAEWVREGESGWVVPAREPEALAQVLEDALKRRPDLSDMGKLARADTEQRAGASCFPAFRKWFSADLN
jgi:glycosyltransferase involved in cell wall biosynthesis